VITFGTIRGQFRALVRDDGVVNPPDSLEELCARSVIEVVAPEGDTVQDHECLLWTAMLGNRDCPIRLHYRGRHPDDQLVVQLHDLRPFRVGGGRGIRVHCGDRGLQLIRARQYDADMLERSRYSR
jgi:hypothetical protein